MVLREPHTGELVVKVCIIRSTSLADQALTLSGEGLVLYRLFWLIVAAVCTRGRTRGRTLHKPFAESAPHESRGVTTNRCIVKYQTLS